MFVSKTEDVRLVCGMADIDPNKIYTYEDYLMFSHDFRCEIIDGVVYDMAPAPNFGHQLISGDIFYAIYKYLKSKGGDCKVLSAPLDVFLFADKDKKDKTIVQPDIAVICDKQKIEKRGIVGAPDIVVEILSPFTAKKDITLKFNKYQQAGVKEYWVVNPDSQVVQVFKLEDGKYFASSYVEDDKIISYVLSGIDISPKEFLTQDGGEN